MRLDLIAGIEACYAPIADDDRWAKHLCDALAPLDRGLGLGASVYDTRDPSRPQGTALRPWGTARDPSAAFAAAHAAAGAAMVKALFWSPPPVTTLWQKAATADAATRAILQETFTSIGVPDALGVFGAEVDHRGVLFAVFQERGDAVPARTRHRLSHLAAHLLCAYRLRRVGLSHPEDARCEAVLHPSGRVEDAREGAREHHAREALTNAARRIERARGHARRVSPDEAVELWRGLVDGTWTLVDHVEAGGHRRILAVRTAAAATSVRGLTPQEREVAAQAALGRSSKYIAYLLGFAPSTVASHLRRAARKLGVRSRGDLVRTFATQCAIESIGSP